MASPALVRASPGTYSPHRAHQTDATLNKSCLLRISMSMYQYAIPLNVCLRDIQRYHFSCVSSSEFDVSAFSSIWVPNIWEGCSKGEQICNVLSMGVSPPSLLGHYRSLSWKCLQVPPAPLVLSAYLMLLEMENTCAIVTATQGNRSPIAASPRQRCLL